MDFDRLPSEILLTVLQRLPFKERVRIACVNRRFKEVSEMAISHTKALCLTAPIFRNANAESMTKLIQLCAPHLKELICEVPHTTEVQYRSTILERLQIVMKFPLPRLAVLKIDTQFFKDAAMLQQLLAGLPNLRTLEWYYPPSQFPKCVFDNLECVIIRCSSEASSFSSMAPYCPNLKEFSVEISWCTDQDIAAFNTAFAKWSALQSFELWMRGTMKLEGLNNLWKMSSLRTLLLRMDCPVTDEVLERISVSLPQLERLHINFKNQEIITTRGFSALKNLKHLRHLSWAEYGLDKTDQVASELISCECLEVVEISAGFSPSAVTVSTLAHRCPKLRRLQINGIRYVNTRGQAQSFVRSLYGFIQENLTINLKYANAAIWKCEEVRSALTEIHSSANGRHISIEIGDREKIGNASPLVNEWDKDPMCKQEKLEKPASFCRRLIKTIRNLPRKVSMIFR